MVDARGYSCPMPVVMVRRVVDKDAPSTLEVAVDSRTAVENVTHYAQNAGYQVAVADFEGDFKLTLTK